MDMWLRYKVKAFFRFIPEFGIRNSFTDKHYDRWLWDRIRSGTAYITDLDTYTANIDGVEVWISNYPYASGNTRVGPKQFYCSRATAVLLQERINEYRFNRLICNDDSKTH